MLRSTDPTSHRRERWKSMRLYSNSNISSHGHNPQDFHNHMHNMT